ncbi:MAG: multidrug transporter [Firmicutes bacterium]|nr:multidrug transporter [Bacillota bacterium]
MTKVSNNQIHKLDLKIVPIMITLLLGGFISLLNETILNVAFPKIMSEMHIGAGTVQWLATGYMLVVGILVPITAFLIHTFTTKQLYNTAIVLFLIGTLSAGFSTTFPMLLISRMFQACGTGMLVPIMMNTILVINPPEKHGAALGLGLFVILFAPAIGPTIAGLILNFFNWNGLFFCLVPFALLAIVLGSIYLKNVSTITKPKIDALSIILSTLGFGGIIYGISASESAGLFNSQVLIASGIGLASVVLFVWRQLGLKQPMLEVRAFKYPMFAIGVLLIMINMMIWFSLNIILPTFMQNALGVSSVVAGLALLPGGLINGIFSPLTGRMYDKLGAKILLIAGFVFMGIPVACLACISINTSLALIIALHCVFCLGGAFIMAPAQTNSLKQLPPQNAADGVAIINTSLQIAAAMGSSLFIGLMEAGQRNYLLKVTHFTVMEDRLASLFGMKYSLLVAIGFILVGLILAVFVKSNQSISNQQVSKSEENQCLESETSY